MKFNAIILVIIYSGKIIYRIGEHWVVVERLEEVGALTGGGHKKRPGGLDVASSVLQHSFIQKLKNFIQ